MNSKIIGMRVVPAIVRRKKPNTIFKTHIILGNCSQTTLLTFVRIFGLIHKRVIRNHKDNEWKSYKKIKSIIRP